MAKGNEIVVSANPRGRFTEGIVDGTPKPGTFMQIKSATAPVGGRFTWEAYNRDADGNRPKGPLAILLSDHLQGKGPTDAYADEDRCFLYIPLPGDELNVLFADVAGTADDLAIGDIAIIDDGTGKAIATTGTPETEPLMVLEAVTDPTADHLVWCYFTGY